MGMESRKKPKRVAIVAMGMSHIDYTQAVMKHGGNRKAVADEVWTINKMAGVIHHDLAFRMDDLRHDYPCNDIQVSTWEGDQRTGDLWYQFLKTHPGPIMTAYKYPEWPNTIAFPLEDVINDLKTSYLTSTPAYAVAYAIYIGVEKLSLYGVDYNYLQKDKKATEEGRCCVEYLLRIAEERDILIDIARNSTLMCTNTPMDQKMYGYNAIVEVRPHPDDEERVRVVFREDLDKQVKDEREEAERATLDIFLKKYKPHLLDALPEEGAVQDESHEKENCKCPAQEDTATELPM